MKDMTPVIRLGDYLGNTMYMKREDLIPFSFGGNKVRISQEFLNDMKKQKKNCMIGYGNARSNLCRVLANLCASEGIPCHIISPADNDGEHVKTSNQRLVKLCGAVLHYCDKKNVAETVQQVMDDCAADGFAPYYINGNKFGKGNEAIPVNAYVRAYQEICSQEQALGVRFDTIFLATGTGMTQAGLMAGALVNRHKRDIIGISVSRGSEQEQAVIAGFFAAYREKNKICEEVQNPVVVCDQYLAGGYGMYNDDILQTIRDVYCQYGISLDPNYTGKAFWGTRRFLEEQGITGKNILFLHTGGTPLFFDMIGLF